MFSKEQKQKIAMAVETFLLSFDHPEMPKERPEFHLHVKGKEEWSWADIEPNWHYEKKDPLVNSWNEAVAATMEGEDNKPEATP